MDEQKKSLMIAEAERVEAIRDFFNQWWTMSELYETAARYATESLSLLKNHNLTETEVQVFSELLDQHMMLLDLVKPFADGKEEQP